jgi:adenylate cyclase
MEVLMAQELKRKLTAILSADVKGYSRLMGDDEEWTVRTLDTFKGVMTNVIPQHRGRVVDSTGDNLLAEFASVVDAVQAAVEIQQVLRAKNSLLPENRRMEFRIGINLGDVIEEGDRIFGDGVNIAARLEGLAEAGGICISGSAFEQIENKLPLHYDYLGEHEVKNITRPVQVYRALMDNGVVKEVGPRPKAKGQGQRITVFGLIGALVIISGIALWQYAQRPTSTTPQAVEKADPQKMAFPLPDKPSIAVLPFANMSDDKDFEYFSDGLTEEVINGLSKVDRVFVIARNSTFTYKGKPLKVQQVAEEMGVRYVLEGSVRKTGEKVRITIQLVDALNGHHIFSERYDREFKDILSVQDEITMNILAALQVHLTKGEVAGLVGKGTKNLDTYFKVLQATQFSQNFNRESFALARKYAEEAIAQDPEYFASYAVLSSVIINEISIGANKIPRAEALQKAVEAAKKAVDLYPCSYTHSALGAVYIFQLNLEQALSEAEQAVALSPNSAHAYFVLGSVLFFLEKPNDAIAMFQKSLRLSPIPINSPVLIRLALSYWMAGQNEEAIAAFKRLLELWPDNLHGHAMLAATYSNCGRDAEARAEAKQVLRIDPNFNVERYIKSLTIKNQMLLEQWTTGLHRAGLR